jgi:hypothetical protein
LGSAEAGKQQQEQEQQQQRQQKPSHAPASAGKKRPCLKHWISWAMIAVILLLAVIGTAVGVVLGRRSAQEVQQQQQQQSAAAATARGPKGDTLQYSVNIRMAPDSKGNPGPSCATLFGGPSPRTVSEGINLVHLNALLLTARTENMPSIIKHHSKFSASPICCSSVLAVTPSFRCLPV